MKPAIAALALALVAFAPAALAQDAGAPKSAPAKPVAPAKAAPAKPDARKPDAKKTEPKPPAPAKVTPAKEEAKQEAAKSDDPKVAAADSKKVEPATTARAESADVPPPPVDVHAAPPPDQSFQWRSPVIIPSIQWVFFQLLPSPEIVVGRSRTIAADGTSSGGPSTSWGLKWQFTPFLWSWGIHRKQNPFRTLVVDPLARVSGSIELSTSIEYLGGEVNRPLLRPALRTYVPVLQRGENLAISLGTSIYRYDGSLRVAGEVGAYVLNGFLGVNVVFAPTHAPLTSIITFNIRYF